MENQTGCAWNSVRSIPPRRAVWAAQAGCGIAMVPHLLVDEELRDGKLIIPWHYEQPSDGSYFVAYSEHSAEVPKIKAFVAFVQSEVASGL